MADQRYMVKPIEMSDGTTRYYVNDGLLGYSTEPFGTSQEAHRWARERNREYARELRARGLTERWADF